MRQYISVCHSFLICFAWSNNFNQVHSRQLKWNSMQVLDFTGWNWSSLSLLLKRWRWDPFLNVLSSGAIRCDVPLTVKFWFAQMNLWTVGGCVTKRSPVPQWSQWCLSGSTMFSSIPQNVFLPFISVACRTHWWWPKMTYCICFCIPLLPHSPLMC